MDDEVYTTLPPGFSSSHEHQVCPLRESLDGLCQASHNWYSKFVIALTCYDFKQFEADHSLFTFSRGSTFLAVLVYVNDMILALATRLINVSNLRSIFNSAFELRDWVRYQCFLGIEVTHRDYGLFLSERKYAIDILTEYEDSLNNSKPFYVDTSAMTKGAQVELTGPAILGAELLTMVKQIAQLEERMVSLSKKEAGVQVT
ncbi:hypothetical protein CRG98_044106 [Punica granatum]|uniref:Reverse transcriptase Ty1/copia-type domain-containing protein n=1 Tax=Punica granatum TaxID=22663 RepID=A0A2I0HV24_PUNGR|nr:hypothetical protein CRG98_044106 [Punica granatum]